MTTAIEMGISDEAILKGLDTVKVKGRVEAVKIPGNYTLLIDYAHNALSMENILETLREYNPHRLIVLFGAVVTDQRLEDMKWVKLPADLLTFQF